MSVNLQKDNWKIWNELEEKQKLRKTCKKNIDVPSVVCCDECIDKSENQKLYLWCPDRVSKK